jgi:hypothetical protein
VKRPAALLACVTAALVVAAGDARATNECRGFMVCVPVAGPWVVVPAQTRRVEYQLTCPRGYVVGGLDAELSERAIEITFPGLLGSPVNPGITTSRSVVFSGFYTGVRARVTTFRPHIGCIPASGGGGGIPPFAYRAVAAAVPPGRPTVRRVRTVGVVNGRTSRITHRCAANERLLRASHAVGIYTTRQPSASLATSVVVTRRVRGGRVAVAVSALRRVPGIVQVHAICAGGSR